MYKYDRHVGDDLLSKDRRLEYHWKWSRVAARVSPEEIKNMTHFQCSFAKTGSWEIEATQWGDEPVYYEASIHYRGEPIKSISTDRNTGFKTRIEAQIAAEKLLKDWIKEQYKLIISKP